MTPSPVMVLRLHRGGAYLADLALLRARAAAGRGAAAVLPVTISHPASPTRFEVYLNLSPRAASGVAAGAVHRTGCGAGCGAECGTASGAARAASFDILGFRNAHGAWHFRVPGTASLPDAAMPDTARDAVADPAADAADAADGTAAEAAPDSAHDAASHTAGEPDAWPAIDNAALGCAVAALAAYAGEPVGPALHDALARMRIVLSDALRVDAVAAGVNAILVSAGSFRPSPATLRGRDDAPPG